MLPLRSLKATAHTFYMSVKFILNKIEEGVYNNDSDSKNTSNYSGNLQHLYIMKNFAMLLIISHTKQIKITSKKRFIL
ncbi:hypothetical protein C6501_15240 [Candidatus Poribacteria bacterium]|nr:MAG: hypothetical protein C6501_15240 [Candidatus Poribacteria bacterium]